MKAGHVVALMLGGAVLGGAVVAAITGRPKPSSSPALAEADSEKPMEAAPAERARGGLAVIGGMLVVTDPTMAFRTIGDTCEEILSRGPCSAEDVLVYLCSTQFPDIEWPPPAGTEASEQWAIMVDKIAIALADEITQGVRPRAPATNDFSSSRATNFGG